MAFADQVFYCNAGNQSTTGHYAVAQFAASTAYSAGQLVRQLTAPAVGNERVFVVIVAGTSSTEPSWTLTRGAKNTSGAVTFQECTGASAVNGDLTNTPNWTTQKATGSPTLGAIIKRNNNASYQICSTAGTLGASEPAFSDTAGTTTTEGTTTWTSLGAVGNFTGGQAPHARLANACTASWFAAGNRVYIADNHAESQAGADITIVPVGSATTVDTILCHNHAGSYPPAAGDLTTGASVSVSTAGNNITIGVSASGSTFYCYGVAFKAGVGVSSSTSNILISPTAGGGLCYFDACSFWLSSTNVGGSVARLGTAGTTPTTIIFNNTTLKFAVAASYLMPLATQFVWQNTAPALVSGSVVPTILFSSAGTGSNLSILVLEALDLSLVTTSLFSNAAVVTTGSVLIKDCKLNASAVVAQPGNTGMTVQLVRSDSAATAYKSARYAYEGTETTETSITRVGGASDPTGQAQSRKIVTTANAQWLRPFKAEPYAIWNPTTGSNVTVTIYGTINAGALPNNDDIWLEVEYLGSATSPLGTILSTTKSNLLAANAAVASDSSTWNGGGSGAGWSPFKLVATLSSLQPGMAGYLHARVRVAAPTMTCYIDPLPVLS